MMQSMAGFLNMMKKQEGLRWIIKISMVLKKKLWNKQNGTNNIGMS